MTNRSRLQSIAAALLLALLAAALPSASAAVPPVIDAAAPGARFVGLLVKEDYAAAIAQCDATMKSALPETKLRDTWQAVIKQVGPFQKQLRTRTSDLAGMKIILVTCQFEKAALDVKVVLDASGQVTGLFFSPTSPDAGTFKIPTYAKPTTYHEMDATVGGGEWTLPGTLTMPTGAKSPVPAVVLVHGSGPGDRDETVGGNKPFRDLAWGLATRGIAVLRYEKRTRQYSAKLAAAAAVPGDLGQFTVKEETIDDALAAIQVLRKQEGIDPQRVFVLGHSLGAMLAPRIGQGDAGLAGLILLAGATRPLEDVMVEQTRYLAALSGPLNKDDQARIDAFLAEAAKVKKLTPADVKSSALILNAPPSYWLDLRGHDPVAIAQTLKLPLLILQGARDYQVTTADFDGWKNALAAQANVTCRLYPNLNHLFVAGQGKSVPAEYDQAGNVDEQVVADIAQWILPSKPAKVP